MSLTIGIDASRAVKKNRTGPENYSYEIIRAILALPSEHQFILYAPHLPLPSDSFPEGKNITWEILPQQRLWSQVKLARAINADPPDVLFVSSHVVPLMSHVPTVVMIHDFGYKYFPQTYSAFARRYQNFSTGVSVAKARRVIVPSQATYRDLLKFYPSAKDKTVVISEAYDGRTFHPAAGGEKSPQTTPYIFYSGRVEEKKNVRLLLDAFNLFCKEKKKVNLVLAGKAGYGFELIQKRIQALPLEVRSRIFQPGHLTQYDLVRYLQHAAVFAFPSHYEGFGLSVLEALATGTPVVCSNSSSLPEIAGDAAILLSPTNALSWAGAFSRIINQPEVARQLSVAAVKQAAKFTWKKAATETLKLIEDAQA